MILKAGLLKILTAETLMIHPAGTVILTEASLGVEAVGTVGRTVGRIDGITAATGGRMEGITAGRVEGITGAGIIMFVITLTK